MTTIPGSPEDRWLKLADAAAELPERLLLAHARGEVLFITGAGTSQPSRLPSFRDLVVRVYERLDPAVHPVIATPRAPGAPLPPGLSAQQLAEIRRFDRGDYDVTLGMLERRMDGVATSSVRVREAVCHVLRMVKDAAGNEVPPSPAPIHRALMKLAVRGSVATIVTTNFECLLQTSGGRRNPRPLTYSLGAMPRPSRGNDFAGVLHIHGVLSPDPSRTSEIVVTDRDFGEYYLRRRVVPDFIYDAARLYNLVLVGYSANDAPMRYLLNAVAADGNRFTDLKERFTFFGMDDPFDQVELEDWRGRGITPIPYSNVDGHSQLLRTLERWSKLSTFNGDLKFVDRELRRIVQQRRANAAKKSRTLFRKASLSASLPASSMKCAVIRRLRETSGPGSAIVAPACSVHSRTRRRSSPTSTTGWPLSSSSASLPWRRT